MMRSSWGILVAVWLGGGISLSADTVILTNGDRIEGQIVQQSAEEVSIRRLSEDGRIRFVQKIPRSNIHAVKEGEVPDLTPKAESRPADEDGVPIGARSVSTHPARGKVKAKPSVLAPADRQELLKTAIDQWNRREYGSAGISLSRLINNLNEQDLAAMSGQTEKALDMSLGDFAAEAHFRAAIDAGQNRANMLQYVTRYEKPYLIPRLEDAYEGAVSEEVGVVAKTASPRFRKKRAVRFAASRPAEDPPTDAVHAEASQPADAGPASQAMSTRTIVAWLDRPEEFDLSREEARPFARRVIFAVKLASEMLRLDPEAQKDGDRREELIRTKRKLYALYRVAIARAGGALTPEEREAQQAVIEEQQERLRKIVESNQRRQQAIMEQAIQAAREQGGMPQDPQVPTRIQPRPQDGLPNPVNTDDVTATEQILKRWRQESSREK